MSVTGIVYLVNKATRHISFAGEVPETYGQITGLKGVDYSVLRDLGSHFPDEQGSYANLGFLTENDARDVGVPLEDLVRMKQAAWELKWESLEVEREALIQAQRWRIDRYRDETDLGVPHTEDIMPVLQYCQDIRNLPIKYPDPYNIVWPTVPA